MLKFAIIGFGGLGKVHFKNAIELEKSRNDIKLVAICDVDEKRFNEQVTTNLGGNNVPLDLSGYKLYQDADVLMEEEVLDSVITALPTYLHADIAIKALEKGLHVFSEKPMARHIDECEAMIEAADKNNKLLMIGQCLRYFPEYVKLKEFIDSKVFGEVIRGEFSRYSLTPTWSWENWLLDYEKSGGAALDLHVHDVDYINWVFGLPKSVTSFATHEVTRFDSIFTTYCYEDKLITSSCDWGITDSFPFRSDSLVRFEKATVELSGGSLIVYPQGSPSYTVDLESIDGYMAELQDFISCIQVNKKSEKNPPESVMNTVKLALAEIASAEKEEEIVIL